MTPVMTARRTIALPGLSITAACEPGADCHVALSGELDLASAGPLHAALTAEVTDHEAVLVLDAGALRFCDASGLGALVRTANFAEARGAGVTVTHASPMLAMLMSLTGLNRRFGLPRPPAGGAGRRPL